MALADVLLYVKTALANCGEWAEGSERVAEESAPPRYVIERSDRIRFSNGGAMVKSATAFGISRHSVQLHCWGKDESHCERMLAAFETVTRALVGPTGYELGEAEWTKPGWATHGSVLVAEVVFVLPRIAVSLPAEPGGEITDKLKTFVNIGAVGFNTTGASTTDGKPTLPDK